MQRPQNHYTPPTAPHVPVRAVQSLSSSLRLLIEEVDTLRNEIAAGNQAGVMPNWDALMKRYGVLLGLIKSLTSYIQSTAGAAAAVGAGTVGVTGPNASIPPRPAPADPDAKKSTVPTLAQYLVHPLEPMSDPTPLAQETFFQAINTQLLPAVKEADEALVQKRAGEDESRLRGRVGELRTQLDRDRAKTAHLAEYIDKVASGFNWEMRPDMEDDEDEDDDLFGGGSDDDGDVQMHDGGKKDDKKDEPQPDPAATNPRHGWSVTDYLRLLDTGKPPPVAPAVPEVPQARADGLTHTSPAVVAGAVSIS